MHQLFDHLLADEAILLACQFSDRLRDSVDDFICLCAPPNAPRPVQHGVGSNWTSVFRARADFGGRLFTAKLSVVLDNLMHQLFDHLLADEAILLACQFSDRLRDSVDDFICFSPAGETVSRSAPGAHAAARSCFSVSAADTFTSVQRFKGSISQ